MAVSKIKKFHIFAHLSLKESMLKELQKLSCVEITKIEKKALFHEWEKIGENTDDNVTSELNKVKFCIDLFNLYKNSDDKKSVRIIHEKETIDYEELSKIISNFNYDEIYQNCKNLDSEINNLKLQKSKLNNTFNEVLDWEELELDLAQTNKSRYINYILATVNKNVLNIVKEDLAKKNILSLIEIVKEEKNNLKVIIIGLKEKSEELKKIIQKHQVEIFNYPQPLTGTPKQILSNIKLQLDNIDNRLIEIADQLKNIGKENKEIYKIYDYLATVRDKESIKENIIKSENAFVIKGWVKNKEIPKLEKKLNEHFKEYEVFFTEPDKQDQVPVSLENHKLVEPFEVITELYSLPNYFEIDPTPILSVFYFIFFGLCLSDVGYGAAIAIICYLSIKKFKLEGSAKKFLTLLYYCGIAGIFGGILVGSWFGDILNYLPSSLGNLRNMLTQKIALFDPTNNPIPLLILSLVLGVIHVYVGIILKFVDNIKSNKLADGLMDQISWILFLTGIIMVLVKG
ncbi:MAG: V-type ATPase 116kDa subunit family protein, partial [Atribacterota bacterium]|nr:V-type ATPase 116kDa subunit family protein [Atribacterota bacterium]